MLYIAILRFSVMRFFSYPVEILASLIKVALSITFLIFFWSLYIKSSHTGQSLISLASYFFLAIGVNELVMAQWGELEGRLSEAIKNGSITNYLLKPLSILPAFYMIGVGKDGVNKLFALFYILIGLFLNPPHTLISYLLFLIFFLGAVIISYAYNVLVATIFFYSSDASGFRNALNHMIGVVSGIIIPLYLFPQNIKGILFLLPFPWMVYGPVQALHITELSPTVIIQLLIVFCWCIILNIAAYLFWQYSLQRYEAVGV